MPKPTDPDLLKLYEAGPLVVPWLQVWVATQLTAARFQAPHALPSSAEWRAWVLRESLHDALELLKEI